MHLFTQKWKLAQFFSHPQGILGMSDIPYIFETILSVPICIIDVNGAPVSESE